MKTWHVPLVVLLVLLLFPDWTWASEWHWQDGVIIQKVDGGYLYMFPSSQGRIKGNENPAGVINVGSTITVMYSLKLIGRAKTRFIGLDTSRVQGVTLPNLTVIKANKAFGFFVRDTNQTTMRITVEPSFMQKLVNLSEEEQHGAIASQGNLNVTLSEKRRKIIINRVILD